MPAPGNYYGPTSPRYYKPDGVSARIASQRYDDADNQSTTVKLTRKQREALLQLVVKEEEAWTRANVPKSAAFFRDLKRALGA